YFHHLMSTKAQGDPYVLPNLLAFTNKEKRANFIEALQLVVNRHDILRTCIVNEGLPQAVQVVLREATLSVEELVIDNSKDILSELKLLTTPGNQWMDVSKAPLLALQSADDLANDNYYLIINQHHLVLDHVGLEKITSEIILYLSGNESNLPEPVLYRDFIGHILHLQTTNDSASYFKNLLGSIDEPTYPFEQSNIRGNGKKIKESNSVLSEELSKKIRDISVGLGVSPAILFHAAYGIVVGKCSNKNYALFGSLFSGRLQGSLGAADSLGLFINTLPFFVELKGSVSEYINEVKKRLGELLPHEQTPLSNIQSWSGISNEIPLFSALLNFRHSPISLEEEEESTIDLGVEIIGSDERTNYPLTLSVDDFGVVFGLTVQADESIESEKVLSYMQGVLVELLEALKEEKSPVSNLTVLSEAEISQLLEDFNATELAYPEEKTIVDLFEIQAQKTPEATAIVYEGEVLSYKDLDERSNQLAHYLESQGVCEEAFVGICIGRSLEMIVGILGILKSGSAYVPIDPEYPQDRINYMLEDAKINLVLSSTSSSKILNEIEGLTTLTLDEEWSTIAQYSIESSATTITPSNLAYVIYTSGSTGRPKGVQIEHKNVVSLCTSCDYISLNSDTVWLSTGSISFDATTIEYWGTLLNGGELVLTSTETLLNTTTFKELIEAKKVNTLWMTASWFHQVVEEDTSVFETLKYLLVGGDTVLFNYTNKLKGLYPNLKIINGYGPTENTTFSTTYTIEKSTSTLPIGYPIKNSYVYIVDSDLNLVPVGVAGELLVGGSGVGRGYLNNEELTKQNFIQNPFKIGDRLYKTGDLAKWLPDGTIEFIGRKDAQVKIRGYRIELGEIENALSSLTSISHSCVLAKEDATGAKRLIGYVVSEETFDKELVQEELKEFLPDYMIPSFWISLDEMPLTSNGKLDRKGLPEFDGIILSSKEFVAPRNKTEEQLVAIWQNLLGIEKIGIHDNFFELGGHSLLATRLVSMIRKVQGIEISIQSVFEHATISDLATHISTQSKGIMLPAIITQDRPENIPLSFSQERLWFIDKLEGTQAYHIPTIISLEGLLDVALLEQSLKTIVARHEVLRTNIIPQDGIGYQKVIPSSGWFLEKEIIEEELLVDNLGDFLGKPFDLSQDYMLRSKLYDVGNDKHVLACVFHHISSDAWSENILISEFMELYSSLQSGREARLPELSLQYPDYAIWQRKYLEGEVLENQLSYWKEKLTGVSTLELPTDYTRPSVQSIEGANTFLIFDEELTTSIKELCKEEGVTLFMLLLSAFKVLLSRYSGQNDICVGTPIANRTQSELEGMIGFFVNTLALRSDLSNNPSFKELLNQVKQTTLEGYDHQLAPFEKVVDKVMTTRDMSVSPLFQVMFALQNTPVVSEIKDSGFDLGEVEISEYEHSETTTQFDLVLNASENGLNISLNVDYCTALFKETTILQMLEHYKNLLTSIVNDVEKPIDDLPILTEAESVQLLEDFNATDVAYDLDKTLVDLFTEQVAKTPKAIAVVYENESLTYQELDKRSNQLGHYLQAQGVEPDTLVGICLERSIEMLVGILGILKSGGAYVPIDPEYP
ncbi:amino acid adenylation domain-containing protein, partial [Tenacibaculum sp. 190524A02b]|uniref:amino acid adenylation domain-containing protein n=1 Tax=Tenacibaculum vairaonense TaxID=3137860 RepID=UPI0032B2170E